MDVLPLNMGVPRLNMDVLRLNMGAPRLNMDILVLHSVFCPIFILKKRNRRTLGTKSKIWIKILLISRTLA